MYIYIYICKYFMYEIYFIYHVRIMYIIYTSVVDKTISKCLKLKRHLKTITVNLVWMISKFYKMKKK